MSKIKITTLLALTFVLVFSAFAGNNVVTAEADQYDNLLEHEEKTVEQARILQENLRGIASNL